MKRIKRAEVPLTKVWGPVSQRLPLEPAAYQETDRSCLFVLTTWKTTEESKGRKERRDRVQENSGTPNVLLIQSSSEPFHFAEPTVPKVADELRQNQNSG